MGDGVTADPADTAGGANWSGLKGAGLVSVARATLPAWICSC